MDRQVEFQKLLKSLMGTAASSPDVFYQPPGDQVLTYPFIIYERSTGQTMHANNGMYSHLVSYTVKLITRNPKDPLIEKLIKLPKCSFDRPYKADKLYHYVYTIYY